MLWAMIALPPSPWVVMPPELLTVTVLPSPGRSVGSADGHGYGSAEGVAAGRAAAGRAAAAHALGEYALRVHAGCIYDGSAGDRNGSAIAGGAAQSADRDIYLDIALLTWHDGRTGQRIPDAAAAAAAARALGEYGVGAVAGGREPPPELTVTSPPLPEAPPLPPTATETPAVFSMARVKANA